MNRVNRGRCGKCMSKIGERWVGTKWARTMMLRVNTPLVSASATNQRVCLLKPGSAVHIAKSHRQITASEAPRLGGRHPG